jgi:hypothetical protein
MEKAAIAGRTQAQDKTERSRQQALLIGVSNHGRIKKSRGLDGELGYETRSHQWSSLL